MILPSRAAGPVTHEVGYLEHEAGDVAVWLQAGLGSSWEVRSVAWDSLERAAADLSPSVPLTRYAAVPVGSWTLILSNGPQGTDVGLLPSQAARELECRAIRAVCVEDDEPGYPARVLEVFGPDGAPPLASLRSIIAANDGGRWVFEANGEPFHFERVEEYSRRRKTDRFTCELLYEYLRALRVPIDAEPEWGSSLVVELASAPSHRR